MGIFDQIKNAFGGKAEAEAEAEPKQEPAGADLPANADRDESVAIATEFAPADSETYTVQSGDTLWKISEQVYGEGSSYMKIFEANTGLLETPEQIFPGQELIIPQLED
jgi:nucleoid-associated protein YgaU